MKTMEVLYRTVQEKDLAVNVKSGSLAVLATPQMCAWMEEAACLIAPCQAGETSVGTALNITHDAPSPLGARIRIMAELEEVRGRILVYRVAAFMHDTCIGQGSHKRAIVNAQSFMSKLK